MRGLRLIGLDIWETDASSIDPGQELRTVHQETVRSPAPGTMEERRVFSSEQ